MKQDWLTADCLLIEDLDQVICQVKSSQIYLYSPKSQITDSPQWALQFAQQHPLSLDPHIVQGKTPLKNPFNREKYQGRNLRKSNRGGIPLPGRTGLQ